MNVSSRISRLGEILNAKGWVSAETIEHFAPQGDGRLGERLLRAQVVRPAQLVEALAEQFGLPTVELECLAPNPEIFKLLSATLASRYGVAPLALENGVLTVAVSDPTDLDLEERLERLTGESVRFALAAPDDIQDYLKRCEVGSATLRDASEDFKMVIVREGDDGKTERVAVEAADEQAPVVRLINTLLHAAIQKRASDIHIEAYDHGVAVKYRIDGVLYPATDVLDRQHHAALVSRLKVMAELDIAEKRIPQDGRFRMRWREREIDFRVSVLPAVFGEDVVIRVLDRSAVTGDRHAIRLAHLGIEPSVMKKLTRAIREPYGMVLITGPTGSGKTTTLYAALSEIHSGDEKIITIEDPVEYQLSGVVQIPVNEKKGLTFARGLRSILRHDPDKIMVGEIRDPETAQIAVQSALTGHLVFTTVHANNVFDVIGRFSHMGLDVYHFVSALNCVMAQRLVRLICPRCKVESRANDELLEASGLSPDRWRDRVWHEGRGCDHCGGAGYRGRQAITEFLALTPKLRDLILERRPFSELHQAALAEGMTTLRQSAIAKALAGDTTLREINRVTFIDG
jgi:type IV pilus assembly protein PilB